MSARKSGEGRECIITNAEALFIEHGYQAVSIRKIADACGMTNAALYYHFENKADLFAEVIRHHAHALQEAIREAAESVEHPKDQLEAMALQYINMVSEERSFLSLFSRKHGAENFQKTHKEMIEVMAVVLQPFEEVIHQAEKDNLISEFPENYSMTPILMGMLHGLGGYLKISQEKSLSAKDVSFVMEIFWRGITSRKTG